MAPARREPPDATSSALLPLMITLLAFGLAIAIIRTTRLTAKDHATTKALSGSIAKLTKTDRIACSFISDDAQTRQQQVANSSLTLSAEKAYLARTRAVLKLFERPTLTPAQRSASAPFISYLQSELQVWTVTRANQAKNITLTQSLALRSSALAQELRCPASTLAR